MQNVFKSISGDKLDDKLNCSGGGSGGNGNGSDSGSNSENEVVEWNEA